MSKDPQVQERLKSLQVRLDGGSFRSVGMDRLERTLDELQVGLDRVLRTIDWDNFQCETFGDLHKISAAVAAVAKSRTEAEKLKVDIASLYEKAFLSIDGEIGRQLSKSPELVEQFRELAREAHSKELKKIKRAKR